MNRLIKIILTLFLFTNLNLVKLYSQNSYNDLVKAEKLFEKGNYKKALLKIGDAIKHKNCTCGNCEWEINYQTNIIRFKIYSKLSDYEQARNALDSIYYSTEQIDSLKIITYKVQLGKEKLKNIIDSSINKSKIECENEICFALIPFENDSYLKFKLNIDLISKYLYSSEKPKDSQIWNDYFLNSLGYKQLE
jgi:hypothetical protein